MNPMFIDTLDYIFISPEWNVDFVVELPHRQVHTFCAYIHTYMHGHMNLCPCQAADGPLPNRKEPSDHLLIAAALSLQ